MLEEKRTVDIDQLIEQYPFYRWFYHKHQLAGNSCDYEQVPILTKDDFFAYEDETGLPYHHQLEARDDLLVWHTSGTTNRPLKIYLTREDLGHHFTLLDNKLMASNVRWRVLMPEFLPCIELMAPTFLALGGAYYAVPEDQLEDHTVVADIIERTHPDIIFDPTGTWLLRMTQRIGPIIRQYTRSVAMIILPEPGVLPLLTEAGMRVIQVYASADLGLIAVSCHPGGPLHVLPHRRFYVQTPEGLQRTGEGQLVGDYPLAIFPLIKYANGDQVRLEASQCPCTFSDRTITFLRRSLQVKIPDVRGYYIDLTRVRNALEKAGCQRIVQMYFDAPADGLMKGRETVRMLATFISPSESGQVKAREDMSPEILRHGSGADYAFFWRFLPVIEVPTRQLPQYDSYSLRPREFIDLTTTTPPFFSIYAHLLEYLREQTGIVPLLKPEARTEARSDG